MILFPAIDLKEGQCVRLFKGRFEEKTVFGHDPAAMAKRWVVAGAQWVHLVDLDGSLGDNQANHQALVDIRKQVSVKLQLGGGIRDIDSAKRWFDLGLDRLILGTAICENPDLAPKLSKMFPGKIAVALDAVGQDLRVRGWQESGGLDVFEVAATLKDQGVSLVIYTDVDRDGTGDGPNVENTRRIAQISGLPTICSGGISALKDLVEVKKLAADGVIGAISGKALYTGSLDFAAGQELLLA